MTDEPTPDLPDQRDERVAELLEVPPLDDVTRRRLVARALDALPGSPSQTRAPASPVGQAAGDAASDAAAAEGDAEAAASTPGATRGRRILAVAAAVVAVVAVAAGVLSALRDDSGTRSTSVAGRTEKRATGAGGGEPDRRSTEAPDAPATTIVPQAVPQASSAAVPVPLGDVGDVSDADRLRAIARGALAGTADRNLQRLEAAAPCLGSAPPGTTLVAAGTGRARGKPVAVLVVAENLNRYQVVRLDATTCAVDATLEL